MNSRVQVLCLPYHNTGAHFIDWSIHYVSGQNVVQDHQHLDTFRNWHHHPMISAYGCDHLLKKVDDLAQTSLQLCTIYYKPIKVAEAIKKLFNLEFESASTDQIQTAEHWTAEDYGLGIRACQDQGLIPAFFDYETMDLDSMYYNDRYSVDWHGISTPKHDVINAYNQSFYQGSAQKFDKEIWDYRELCALTYRPLKKLASSIDIFIDQSRPHLYYTTDDVWNGFERCLVEICQLWQIDIDQQRLIKWQQDYNRWRTVHDPWFSRNLSRIVDAIVNNRYLPLGRFHINFFMEIILQHELITKHNLNLKTWQLEKFPDNAQDLHQLLEPNIHKLR